jgi:PAS domain S-box-containing protein
VDGSPGASEPEVSMASKKSIPAAPVDAGAAVDGVEGAEYVAALAARERAEYALRASEARYREALLATQAALDKSQALYRVASALAAEASTDALLQRLVDTVVDALPADRVDLFAIDAERAIVTGNFHCGRDSERVFEVGYEELMAGLSGWVIRERKATYSPGGVRDPREPDHIHERRVEFEHGPLVLAPIFYRDTPLGVIVAKNWPGGREFEQADLEMLSAMANQAAVSIENARVRGMLAASYAELEDRVRDRTAALAQSEERYRRITESVTDYLFHVGIRDGKVAGTTHGPGCVAVTGYSAADFGADSGLWLDMVVPEDRELVLEQAQDITSSGRMRAIEHRIVRKDGQLRWVRSTPVPQYAADGTLVAYDGLIQDVTERRDLQEQLAQAQKLQSIGRLAGGVAHDFNNLLTAILGNAELASMDLDPGHPARESIGEIIKAADGATRLTRQLLAFARRQRIEPVALDLSEVVRASLEMIRRLLGEDIEVVAALDEHLWIAEADPGQIEQVLVNLTVNARDAMPRGGRLIIETANQTVGDAPEHDRAEVTPGQYVTLSVSDTGTGMTEEVMSHLFEPFFTTKPPGRGVGLGLATCHGIVNQSGGHIWLDSALGHGTTVTILLPRSTREAREEREAVSHARRSARGTETVLVVEDEPSVRRLAVLGLRSHGYTVLEAANAAEALRVAATEHDIALVVIDVIMPGMRGPELAAGLGSLRPSARILLTSGHTDTPEAFRDPEGRLVPFLEKPFTPDGLAHKVRAVLDAE